MASPLIIHKSLSAEVLRLIQEVKSHKGKAKHKLYTLDVVLQAGDGALWKVPCAGGVAVVVTAVEVWKLWGYDSHGAGSGNFVDVLAMGL